MRFGASATGVCPCLNVHWFALVAFLLAAMALRAGVAQIQSVSAQPATTHINLLPNPGFEETDANGMPQGWNWGRGSTDAVCRTDDASEPHRGTKSILITNGTPFGPNIYGMLWLASAVRLTEGRTYTMSAWVKSEAPGVFNLIGGGDWQYRVAAPVTAGQWQRISLTFKAEPRDLDFTFRLNTESETPGIWIDDVKLEEGGQPTLDPERVPGRFHVLAEDPDGAIQGDGDFLRLYTIDVPRAFNGAISARLDASPPWSQPLRLTPGLWRLKLQGRALAMDDTPRALMIALESDGQTNATHRAMVTFYSTSNIQDRIERLRQALPQLVNDLQALKAQGADTSYPAVTLTVLTNFVDYAREDAQQGEVRRGLEQVRDLEIMLPRLQSELAEAIAGRHRFQPVPRWTGDKRPVVRRSSFVAPARMPDGSIREWPVFFTGYGHFGRVVDEMEKWPGYGVNLIQIEMGPSRLMPAEGQIDDSAPKEMLAILDRARRSGVAVCLLISPHYFPEWALRKWPALKVRREGFINYCIHAPESRRLLQEFIRALLGPLKDHPALHSVCLSNEPVNQEAPCEPARREWQAWLAHRYRTIVDLNAVAGSNFTGFASVPLPDPFGPRPATALWLDYVRFNQESFAGWHQMLADAVHEVAPDLPVHAKAMTWTMVSDWDVNYGVDATLFGRFSNINGNDSANLFNFGGGGFAQGWELNAVSHDLQRSVLDAPVFNTENHLITDRETRRVPAAHIRAALWQAAIHGQSATTIWVWERTFDPKSDFAGSIMHRPACAEAVGVVACDLLRAAEAVTALQQAPPDVLIFRSESAMVWQGFAYNAAASKLYQALAFCGVTTGFVTERQLEAGMIPRAPVLLVPAVTHISDAACRSLKQYQGRLVMAGHAGLLAKDEHGRDRQTAWTADTLALDQRLPEPQFLNLVYQRLADWGLKPRVLVHPPGNAAQPTYGVESRSVRTRDGLILNLCNFNQTPVQASLAAEDPRLAPVDVLTGVAVTTPLTMAPLEVRILCFK